MDLHRSLLTSPRRPALACLLALGLQACSSPGLRYAGAEPVGLAVGGHEFDVYLAGGSAQVIRTNRVWLPDTGQVMAAGLLAAERASGCRAQAGRIRGDAAIMTVPLDCAPGRAAPQEAAATGAGSSAAAIRSSAG